MKRIFTYIYIIAVALAASVSCSREYVFEENGQDGFITLRLQTAEMGTRVTITDGDPVDGEELENVVKHADFFFFKNEDGTGLLDHKRLEVKEGELVPVTGQDNLYEYKFDVRSENNPLQGPSYVYVIANYPEVIDDAEITSLDDVLALDIPIDLKAEFDSFVMDSYDSAADNRLTYLSPSKGHDDSLDKEGNVKYTIGLTRAAAKLVLSFKVAKSYTDAAQNVWTPVTNQMWWNFLYVRKSGMTMEAEPLTFDVKTNYFNTAQLSPVVNGAADDDYTYWTTSAVYTYPQSYKTDDVTAPYYKLFCPWTCEKKGMNNFYYKIILPDLNVDEEGNNSFKRNKVYRLMVDVSVIGGTEEDWALLTDHIYVADWWAPEKIEASFEGAMYLDVPVRYFEIYGDDSVDIPVVSSNMIQVTGLSGSKTNLFNGQTVNVTPSITNITKEGFRLTHTLDTNMTSSGFDCTPITYTMTVGHTTGGLSKTIDVTVVQYPSIYAKADASNTYTYVNSYANSNINGGRHNSNRAYNSRQNNQDQIGTMNYVGGSGSVNNNGNQYVVTVSVLPSGYRVTGMTEDAVIGDPRGGKLAYNYLGYYGYGDSGNVTRDVQSKYNAISSTTQNVIAPVIRIASSWGATGPIRNYDRAEERCAAYQENGYPAGRWRVPTLAEIDFLIRLSDNKHIPELFSPSREGTRTYDVYWAGGRYGYGGNAYVNDQNNRHSQAFVDLSNATVDGSLLRVTVNNRYEYFDTYVRCVYDEWYWGPEKYDRTGNKITGTGTAANRWIGYIF